MTRVNNTRSIDRSLYGAVAGAFAVIVFAGFARTYYLKTLFGLPPLPSIAVHAHGMVMTAWVLLFITQVRLVASHRVRLHQRLGYASIALAVLMVAIGVWTALRAARFGSPSTPVGFSEPTFSIVPLGDMALFTLFYGAAIFYRRRPARHKRFMYLTVVNFLPPAVGRLPLGFVAAHPVLFGLGVPAVLSLGMLAFDTWRNKKVDGVFAAAVVIFLASFPIRIALVNTAGWTAIATWLATLAG
jgi:hypothetical protein